MGKKKKYLIRTIIGLGLVTFCLKGVTKPEKELAKVNKTITPTVFIHGFMGDDNSMSELMRGITGIPQEKRLVHSDTLHKDVLRLLSFDGQEKTYIVKKNDVQSYSFEDGQKGVIKVVFENAHFIGSAGSINDNSLYLEAAMEEIKKDYGNRFVNLVGHSMGGVTSANYALDMYSKVRIVPTSQAIQVDKLVTFGSPFKGSRYGIKSKDGRIGETIVQNLANGGAEIKKRFGEKQMKFNPNMKVLSFASPTDFFVSIDSAFGMEDYIEEDNFKKVKIYGSHSSMMTKSIAIEEVKSFLQ